MSEKKSFAQLTPAGQKRRLAKYQATRDQYHLKQGLFRLFAVADHGEIQTKNGACHKFGYKLQVAGAENNDDGIADKTVLWMNELVNEKGNAQKAIDARLDFAERLKSRKDKAILVAVEWKNNEKNGTVYRDVNSIYERHYTKKTAAKKTASAPKATKSADDMPF